jgi:hypothetical protein
MSASIFLRCPPIETVDDDGPGPVPRLAIYAEVGTYTCTADSSLGMNPWLPDPRQLELTEFQRGLEVGLVTVQYCCWNLSFCLLP